MTIIGFIHEHIMYLNNSKFFAGCVMIILNICSRYSTIQFSKTAEEYVRANITNQLLIFSIAWMGTRDIYMAILLTAAFTVLSSYLLNEQSSLCIIPVKYHALANAADTNKDGEVTDAEIQEAIKILNRAKKKDQRNHFLQFFEYNTNNITHDKLE